MYKIQQRKIFNHIYGPWLNIFVEIPSYEEALTKKPCNEIDTNGNGIEYRIIEDEF